MNEDREFVLATYNAGVFPPEKEQELMTLAYLFAQDSPDPRTQNAALLVNPKTLTVEAVGVNEFPRYIHPYPERLISPEKYSWIEHAERNSLYFAANRGIRTRGLIMVCPWVACTDCARGIVQAGIVEVISHNFDLHSTVPHWEDSIGKALQMFKEAAVEYREIDGKYGVDIMFNDEKVTV